MIEVQHSPERKYVIIEVADIFLAQDGFESIPCEGDDPPEEVARWRRTEIAATKHVIEEQLNKAKVAGYTKTAVRPRDYCDKKGIDLGLNGMYLLLFVKPAEVVAA